MDRELIAKWEVVSKLITLQNNYTFFKNEWDAERLYREIAKLELEIGKTPAIATDNNVGHKWIPVRERLPENDYGKHWKERQYYLVCLQNGMMRVAHYGYKEHDWWIDSHDCVLARKHYTEVTHWMHLPEPPKGE